MGRPAIFLDRDGVINENRADYVKRWSEVTFLPGVFDALRRLAETDFAVVLITNQSAVGRGIISYEQAEHINRRVVATIEAHGGRVDGVFLCPHHPKDGCECRKPRPGLLLQAAAELALDLDHSFLIGDALSDMEAAQTAGLRGVLVLTGRGQEEMRNVALDEPPSWSVVADLGAAVERILSNRA
jgi:D-glycero-D-manno-heptose 1,7-bisphosphate phosphatase